MLLIFARCENDNEFKKLENYLSTNSKNINNYKVICFVPIDGCGSCIEPSINYAKVANEKLLLVLTSIYKKSINLSIENYNITRKDLITDVKNKASMNGFVTNIAPCYYFIKDGSIIKKVDLSTIPDKKSIIEEVHRYLNE
jgi:hypothetical protein